MRGRGMLAVGAVATVLAAAPPRVTAQEEAAGAPDAEAVDPEAADEQARVHFQAGTNYFQVGDYASALREYQRAYALSERAELLYNLFMCHERLGQLEEAVVTLDRFLAERPDLAERALLEERLARLRERLEASREPPPETSAPPEPEPAVVAVAPAEGGGISTVAVATLIGGGALAVLWGAAAIAAFAIDQDLAAVCGMTCPPSETERLFAMSLTADVLLGASVVTLGVGLVLALTTRDDPSPDQARVRVAPHADATGVGLALIGALD